MSEDLIFNPVIVIPCYQHAFKLARNLDRILLLGIPLIIVDDGSPVAESVLIHEWGAIKDHVYIISNSSNQGKGVSMVKAFKKAKDMGFTHAVQIDADGQHNYDVILDMLNLARENPTKVICGKPEYENIPKARLYGHYITHFWVMLELGIYKVIDTMCGFRVYPLDATCKVTERAKIGKRMDFDTDIFVRLYWSGVDFVFHSVSVVYPENGISNFRPFKDNLLLSFMHTRLCTTKMMHFYRIKKRNYY